VIGAWDPGLPREIGMVRVASRLDREDRDQECRNSEPFQGLKV